MHPERTLFEISSPGREGFSLPKPQVPEVKPADVIPAHFLRNKKANLPELSEFDVVRHFTRLSQWNYSIDTVFYPLGSCTMKYNPRINEETARLPGFAQTHPWQTSDTVQGNLQLMYELQNYLCEISGMDACTLQPAAGAQGELAGLLMIRAYHNTHGRPRKKVLIPDSAHGTNPASAALAGYEVVTIKTGTDGLLHPDALAPHLNEDVACLMVTNPNTLGLFETHMRQIAIMVHEVGGLVYCDGANMNAVLGNTRMGDMGVDCMHFNLHKTFTTPHGGGGPGSGPVVVKKNLEPFLPVPIIEKDGLQYHLTTDRPQSIGQVRAFFGNFGMFVRAYTYIRELGPEGVKKVSQLAVLNARYLRACLEDDLSLAFETTNMHEAVFSDKFLKHINQSNGSNGEAKKTVKTIDLAKRLIDYGFHPPTVYFPLNVTGALMMEPTETESKETLDAFVAAIKKIVVEAKENPQLLLEAPHYSWVKRLDETKAAREPKLREKLS